MDAARAWAAARSHFDSAILGPTGALRSFTVAPAHRTGRADFLAAHWRELGLGDGDTLVELRSEPEPIHGVERTATRFAHWFRGVPVVGSELILHEESAQVVGGAGNLVRGLSVGVQPAVTEDAARARAMAVVAQYATSAASPRVLQGGDLAVLSATGRRDPGAFALAWRYVVVPSGRDAPYAVDIDALTGAVLAAREDAQHITPQVPRPGGASDALAPANTTLTGKAYYAGEVSFTASGPGGSPPYSLATVFAPASGSTPPVPPLQVLCQTNGTGRRVDFDGNRVPGGDTSFIAPGAPPSACDGSMGIQSLWAIEQVFDYWSAVFHWNGIDDKVGPATSPLLLVDGNGFSDAAYTQSTNSIEIRSAQPPFDDADILGHEMGHAMEDAILGNNFSCLTDAAAVSEGLADVLGMAVKDSLLPAPTWILGQSVKPVGIRNLQNPKGLGQPDTYLGKNYLTPSCVLQVAGGPVHDSIHFDAAVLGYWFYLVSMGGQGTIDDVPDPAPNTPDSQAYSVTPLMLDPSTAVTLAAQLVQTALRDMPSGPTYQDVVTATEYVASETYGASSSQSTTVADAWRAVGLGDGPTSQWHWPATGTTDWMAWPAPLTWQSDSAQGTAWDVEIASSVAALVAESGNDFHRERLDLSAASALDDGTTIVSFDGVNLKGQTTYYWRTRTTACLDLPQGGGCLGHPWSPIWRFSTGGEATSLVSPTGAWSATFKWDRVPGASEYELHLAEDESRGGAPPQRVFHVPASETPEVTIPLVSQKGYAWWVVTHGPAGAAGPGGAGVPAVSPFSATSSIITFRTPANAQRATASESRTDAWSYRFEIEPPDGTEHTDYSYASGNLVAPISGTATADDTDASPMIDVPAANLAPIADSTDPQAAPLDVTVTPHEKTPYVPLTDGCTVVDDPFSPVDPEVGETTHDRLSIDWRGTIPEWGPTTAPTCDYGAPLDILIQPPKDAKGVTKYVLTLTPNTGGQPLTYTTTSSATASDPNWGDWPSFEINPACTDSHGYTKTVQAFKDDSQSEPGAMATGSYIMAVGPAYDLSPGVPVVSHAAPPTVDASAPVTFSWSDHNAPYGYEVYVVDGLTASVDAKVDAGSTYTASLKPATTYTWSVRALEAPGVSGHVDSETYTFTTGGLVAPTPVKPVNGAPTNADAEVTFEWTKVSSALGYFLSVAYHGSHDPVLSDQFVTETHFTIPAGTLVEGATYDWTIAALGGGGDTAASAPATFTTKAPAPPPSPTSLEEVADLTCSCAYVWINPDCYVSWDDGIPPGADRWDIQLTGQPPPGYQGPMTFVTERGDPGFTEGSGWLEYQFQLPAGNASLTVNVQARDTRTNAGSPWVGCELGAGAE